MLSLEERLVASSKFEVGALMLTHGFSGYNGVVGLVRYVRVYIRRFALRLGRLGRHQLD